MSSFAHRIESATQRDRDRHNHPHVWGENREHISPPCGCCWPKCHKPEVVYVVSYRYITGRAGRVGIREQFVCQRHGREFAAKNKLVAPDPAIPGTTKSAREHRADFVNAALG